MGKKGEFDILKQIKKFLKMEEKDRRGEGRKTMGWIASAGLAGLLGFVASCIPGSKESYDKVIKVYSYSGPPKVWSLKKGEIVKECPDLMYVDEEDGILFFERMKIRIPPERYIKIDLPEYKTTCDKVIQEIHSPHVLKLKKGRIVESTSGKKSDIMYVDEGEDGTLFFERMKVKKPSKPTKEGRIKLLPGEYDTIKD